MTFVARALLHNCTFAKLEEKPTGLDSLFMAKVFDYLFLCRKNNQIPRADTIFNPDWGDESQAKLLIEGFDVENQKVDKEYFDNCVKIIKTHPLIMQKEQLLTKVKSGLDGEQLSCALQEIDRLTLEIDSIDN